MTTKQIIENQEQESKDALVELLNYVSERNMNESTLTLIRAQKEFLELQAFNCGNKGQELKYDNISKVLDEYSYFVKLLEPIGFLAKLKQCK